MPIGAGIPRQYRCCGYLRSKQRFVRAISKTIASNNSCPVWTVIALRLPSREPLWLVRSWTTIAPSERRGAAAGAQSTRPLDFERQHRSDIQMAALVMPMNRTSWRKRSHEQGERCENVSRPDRRFSDIEVEKVRFRQGASVSNETRRTAGTPIVFIVAG